ncbi:isomerase [Paucimonas lemoignei]|jgi:ketosteroid isomerase-like protein|nr:isomerase [Paucimonas lemoignei]
MNAIKAEQHSTQQQIQSLIEQWSAAIRDKDLDLIMSYYAPEIVAYDAIIALQFKGIDAYRTHWKFCLGMCPGPMVFAQRELVVHGDEQFALAHWLNSCGAADENGVTQSSWMRASAGFRRTAEGWKAVHEHFSAPFDMESGKALFDLQP